MGHLEIRSWSEPEKILYAGEAESIAALLAAAINEEADLTWADLTWANLTGANLTRANLTGANLTRANLTGANLTGANLTRANLTRANLTWANLTGANLARADLTGADLTGANLTRADLTGANLARANLTGANLSVARNDLWAVMLYAMPEVAALRAAVADGRIDGSAYRGECACLVGTIANARHCSVEEMKETCPGIKPDPDRPAERWFLALRPGHTPEKSQVAKITLAWIDEFIRLTGAAVPETVVA
jgi:hypothetical protein